MDDFVITNLHEARNEWCARLVSILTGHVIDGIKSIFNESWKMCVEKGEIDKYLMTFQNLLTSIPKWNSIIVDEEKKRIIEKSGCNHLEELITCVHIIQLKVLTCIRVGNKQKKIDISVPNLNTFIHKVYIHVARKIYSNVYLFEKNITALSQQRNNRELELLVQECILMSVRESIPTEAIIRAYLDESVEEEQEVIIEPIKEDEKTEDPKGETTKEETTKEETTKGEEEPPTSVPSIKDLNDEPVITKLTFNDYDSVLSFDKNNSITESEKNDSQVHAPKNIERLEEISISNLMKKKMEESNDDDDNDKIKIMEPIHLDILDLDQGLEKSLSNDVPLLDIIEL
jgi:hypothetical protein